MILFDSCSTVELTGRRQLTAIPNDQMVTLGKETYQQVLEEQQISRNREYTGTVQGVGQRISAAVEEYMRQNGMGDRIGDYAWEYRVLESDAVNEGIMPVCRDDAGVATVMAHEVAHVIAQHSNERLSQQLAVQLGGIALSEAIEKEKESTKQLAMLAFGIGSQVGVLLPYSRTHEKEADVMGLYFMAMAGYDPSSAIPFMERLKASSKTASAPQLLSTHPADAARINAMRQVLPEAMQYYKKTF